jgi:hypothetical protein
MLELVKNQHFQVACTRYYEITHKVQGQIDLIQHPNSYFDLSMGKVPSKDAKDLDQKYTFKDPAAVASLPSTSITSPTKGKGPGIFGAGAASSPNSKGKEKEKDLPAAKRQAVSPAIATTTTMTTTTAASSANDDFDSMLDSTGDIPDF